MTTNKKVLDFIAQTQELCQPAKIVWIDGSEEQLEQLSTPTVQQVCSSQARTRLPVQTVSRSVVTRARS